MKDFRAGKGGLFDDQTMADIAANSLSTQINDKAGLQRELQILAREIRRVISITPCDLPGAPSNHTHSERLDWVDAHLLNPIERLEEALDPENRFLLSLWPEEVIDEIMPDFDEARQHLQELKNLGQHLAINIAQHRYAKLTFGNLIRFKIVAGICSILDEHWPSLRPSRGTFDDVSKRYEGNYPAVVRQIFREITGLNEQLDRLIKEQIDERR